MREILFRGKRIDNGEWVYGSLVIQSGEWLDKDEKAPDVYFIYGKRGEIYLVDSSTVGQYTGVNDKNDKNGKGIFEGDIIREKYDSSLPFDDAEKEYTIDRIAQIVFNEGSFECVIKGGGKEPAFLLCLDYTEVIGNIHDNPELLEDKP